MGEINGGAVLKREATSKRRALVAFIANRSYSLDVYSFLRGKLVKSEVIILLYHRVGPPKNVWSSLPIPIQEFERQVRYLCQAYEIMPLNKLVQYTQEGKALPSKTAIITFDDGYKDNYLYAYPILRKHSMPATIFLTTGHIGTGSLFWWDKVGYVIHSTALETFRIDGLGVYALNPASSRLKAISSIKERLKRISEEEKDLLIKKLLETLGVDIPADLGRKLVLSWEEVREMSNGGIDFGAHSVTHSILTKLPPKQAKYEIIQSKRDIEEKLGQVVTAFSYPDGQFNAQLIEFLKESGFTCAVTTIPRMVSLKTSSYQLGRIGLGGNFNTFKVALSGLYSDVKAVLG